MPLKRTPGKRRFTTFQVISAGFLSFILLGALLLALPFSSVQEGSVPFADCLFTATSAVCVTGLVVRDTATTWTPFGQAVILLMIQIGGLGVVTAAVMLAWISGKKIGLMQRSTMQEAIAAPQVGGIVRLTRFIVFTSLVIELIGAALLLPSFLGEFDFPRALWYAVFHSVSAFCNAGFDLMGIRGPFSSLTDFSQHIGINLALILLITVGGIGFLVWNDIKEHSFRFKQYRLQSKIVLLTSAALVLIPFLWFMAVEMRQLSVTERILPALFQSVTLRTAGFNTVDLTQISGGGQAVMIFWMLVGGSPGSTAGGMKTTTVAVLLLTARAVFARREQVECMGRRIGDDTVRHAVALLVMYFVLFFVSGVVISSVEGLPLLTCLFETGSAIGTVGVTLGITSRLGLLSRGLLVVLMFMGRVGGLTLIYAAQAARPGTQRALPLEKITVG
ncbi:MAG: Trk family potassium uptake protein [Clostridia bacterium]|nr:Trk family potassium uptake protein [Clostridia bacterium]